MRFVLVRCSDERRFGYRGSTFRAGYKSKEERKFRSSYESLLPVSVLNLLSERRK